MQKISNTILKDFIGFSMSAWISALLSFVTVPVITRVFSTTEVGKINLFITTVNLILNFAYLGIDQAFTRFFHEPPGKNNKKTLLGLCLSLTCIIYAMITIGIFLYKNQLSNTILGYVSYIIPISLALSVLSNIFLRFFSLYSRMEKNILLFNIQTVCITIAGNVSYILVALYKARAEDAIVLRTLFTCLIAVFFFFYSRKNLSFSKIDASKNALKAIFTYALPICPAAVLAVANNSIGQFLMRSFLSYEAIGIYSNAVTVASIITIIQSGVNHYWGPLVFESYKTSQKQIIKMHHMISFVMIVVAFCIIIFQDLIYFLLVGKNFWASKQLFPLLIISPVCYTISETLGIGIRLSKKTYLNIPVYIVNIVVNVIVCVLLLPKIGVLGAAIASSISSITMLVVKSILGEKYYRCSDNYTKLIIALIVLYITAFIHVFVYESTIKYILYLIAITLVCVCYIKEVKTGLLIITDLKNKFLRRKKCE